MSWSNITKFLLGSVLGVAILIGSGVVVAYFLLTKLAEPPPKPYFANDKPLTTVSSPAARPSTPATADSASTNSASSLEPGAYEARVVYSGGLALRDNPSLDATRIGGVEYDQRIVILEESPDKQWQRVRSESGDLEGWVKAGNIERLN
jgi:hypothetical protein